MTLADLAFILAALFTLGSVAAVLIALLRRRLASARRVVVRWAIVAAMYMVVLLAASIVTPQGSIPMRVERCYDDWCITVDSAASPALIGTVRPDGKWLVVSATVRSHAQRISQAEPDAYGYLLDDEGNRYDASNRGQAALASIGAAGKPMGAMMVPGGSFTTHIAFDVPVKTKELRFVKERKSRFPGIVIIGDPVSLLHRRVVVPLPVR